MKRVIYMGIGIVLLLVAVSWGYLAYRQYKSYQTLIPQAATTVVRIQVDGLATAIAWNALWNGEYYRDSPGARSIGLDRKTWNPTGVTIPANVFLYQVDHALSEDFPNSYFGSLQLADSAMLVDWLRNQLNMEIRQGTLGTIAFSERAVVLLRERQALFAISPTRPAKSMDLLAEQLSTLLPPSTSVPVSKSHFAEIQRLDGHLRIFGRHRATVNFKNGEVLLSMQRKIAAPTAEARAPHFASTNAASLWFEGDLSDLLKDRQFEIGMHTLHGDSLLNHYQGRIVMEWRGMVSQQDTAISYDYDENFEMVERQEIVEKLVPEIYLSFLADSGLTHYLLEQRILNATGDAINRDVFPLYQVGVSTIADGYVQLHTAHNVDTPPKPGDGGHDRLQLRVNFSNMDIQEIAPLAAPYAQAFDRFEASGQPVEGNEETIRGKFFMKNQQINSLVQLLTLSRPDEEAAGL